jgi:hypothetical protein
VVAGDLHTHLEPLPAGVSMGAQLAWQRPGLCSINCVYELGRFYNLGCPERGIFGPADLRYLLDSLENPCVRHVHS